MLFPAPKFNAGDEPLANPVIFREASLNGSQPLLPLNLHRVLLGDDVEEDPEG